MNLIRRILPMALGFCIAGGTTALSAVTSPTLTPAPFTKGILGAGNAVTVAVRWLPSAFTPITAQDHHDVFLTEVGAGVPEASGPTGSGIGNLSLAVTNGREYRVRIVACQKAGVCTSPAGSTDWVEAVATTRVDATPPAGTVQINGGASATNKLEVTLALAASDPLIDGRAGTSSGVSEFALDLDGDGTLPCTVAFNDLAGCAKPFVASVPVTLLAGDGVKQVGVQFGDGAREMPVACPACSPSTANPIAGNASNIVTDSIILDTIKPLAGVTQNGSVVDRGGSLTFDASTSAETSPTIGSGIDLATATWNFNDSSPPATGAKVTHAFSRSGTFVGELRIKDRAGNISDPRTFSVTVNAPRSETKAGGGVIGPITGVPVEAFSVRSLQVTASYERSRLTGALSLAGTSAKAGSIVAALRSASGGPTTTSRAPVAAGAFGAKITLPPSLVPGDYTLVISGPAGRISSTLRLTPPPEGVASRAALQRLGSGASATFAMASLPGPALRGGLKVYWIQSGNIIGLTKVRASRTIVARLPSGSAATRPPIRAELRAGAQVISSATR